MLATPFSLHAPPLYDTPPCHCFSSLLPAYHGWSRLLMPTFAAVCLFACSRDVDTFLRAFCFERERGMSAAGCCLPLRRYLRALTFTSLLPRYASLCCCAYRRASARCCQTAMIYYAATFRVDAADTLFAAADADAPSFFCFAVIIYFC